MGVVYKAKDRETGEIVALKILKPEIAADRGAAERFINEVRLSRRITHKNVCRVYEFSRAGSTAYLSMEFVEGESLRAILERMGAVTLRKGTQIARQMCAALHEAHSQGIIHRDLKPENVMLDRAGNVKVMDFGIARVLDSSETATGGIIGTPAYMAPEQAEGRDTDARTDIYATGLILYELFTGQPTFTGDTPITIALKQIRETPAAPRTHEAAIPPDLDGLILKCLEKDPVQRFQSVADLDAALARLSTSGDLPLGGESHQTDGQWPAVETANTTPVGARAQLEGGTHAAQPRDHGASGVSGVSAHRPVAGRRTILAAIAVSIVALAFAGAYFAFWRTRDPIPFTTFTLANGLRVILSEDHSAPTVSVAVVYNAGSRDDPPGRDGLAHLFEHMMFNGSLNVGKGEHQSLVSQLGGNANGSSLPDFTVYWETLPSNQLDLALFLEADRMRSLRLDQARLETERATIAAERQQAVDNAPYGRAGNVMLETAYDIPGYKHSTIGTAETLQKASLQEINDFFTIFYAPNNAVLAVAGDFKPADARARIENYFQHIAAQPPAPVLDLTNPAPTRERRARVEDPFAPIARHLIGYMGPTGAAPDFEAAQILAVIVGTGASSRLHQKLVRDMNAASAIGGSVDQRTGPGLITFVIVPSPDRDEAIILKGFEEVIAQVRQSGVTDAEVQRARHRLRLQSATALQQTFNRATELGQYAARFGDPAGANRHLQRLEEVTPDAVRRAAETYLTAERRTIVTVVPGGQRPAAVAAATPPAIELERLNRAPISKDVIRVSLPSTKESALDNGLTLVVAEDRRVPLVSVRFDVRGAGALHDPKDLPGTSYAVSAMLRQGTATRTGKEVAEQLDTYGVSVTAGTAGDKSVATVNATGLSGTFDQWFPIVADIVVNASFPADELTVMKRRLATDWRGAQSSGSSRAAILYEDAVYGSAAPPRIAPEVFEALTSDRLKAWHRERYAPQTTILTIVGAVGQGDAEKRVREVLGGWPKGPYVEQLPSMPPAPPRRALVLDRPGSVQTSFAIGAAAVDRVHPDYLALVVANRVLGAGPTGRLFLNLRERRGITYGVYSVLAAYKHGGDWRAYGDMNADRNAEAIDALLEELQRIAGEPVPATELDAAKLSIVAGFAVTLEQLAQRVSYIATRRSYGLSSDYWDRYPERIMALTADDVQRAAAKYFDPSRLQIIAVGDASKLEPLLAAKAPVTRDLGPGTKGPGTH